MDNYFQKVYELVEKIPKGKVATYGQIAALLGTPRSARVVGWAMKAAPSKLPCHRVVNKSGELSPFYVFGDQAFQRALLEKEGVTFTSKGTIDMKKHLWSPSPH